ncbi:MAG: TetR/AcrR family transcriptional regulator [Brevinematales bacterium]|nr:TetR/AcrR family transcriptional regulator [Brevinematales bacterium]
MDLKPKDRILESAIKLFAEKGFDATSVDEIARNAEINKAMIYYYFSSKEELLSSIIRKSINEFTSIIEDINLSDFKDLEEIIHFFVEEGINYIDKNDMLIRIYQRESLNISSRWGTNIIDTVGLVFEKVETMIKKMRRESINFDITLVEQILVTNLIIGYLSLKDKLGGKIDEEAGEIIKKRYIDRVSRIIYLLITDEGGKNEKIF